MTVEVQEAPAGSKSPKIDESPAEVDLEAGVGPSTSGAGSPSGPGPLGLSLPPSAQPTSQPTSAPGSAAPGEGGTPAVKSPGSGKPPSKTPGSGKAASKTPGVMSPAGKTPASKRGSAEPEAGTPGVKSKTPSSKGAASKTPQSKHVSPVVHFSPSEGSPRKQSRAEAAEEVIARSQASQRSAVLVTPAKSSKSRTSVKVAERAADEDRGSDRSISPSQRFTPNRGLTEAEIF